MTPASTPTPRAAAGTTHGSPSERKAMALQRIEASRSQLIVHIYPEPQKRQRGKADTSAPSPEWNGMATLMARAERNGFVNAAWRTLRALGRRWWKRQPWHASVDLVASTLAHEAQPIIRRHPWASLAAGAAAGAALMIALPWVTRAVQARARPWRDNLGGMLWQQLAQAPVQLALAGAITAWLTDFSQRAAHAPTPPVPPANREPDTAAPAPP